MRFYILLYFLAVSTLSLFAQTVDNGKPLMPWSTQQQLIRQDPLWRDALRIHYNAIVMDGHVDVPTQMMNNDNYQFGTKLSTSLAHVDLPRMFEGGLDAPFFSIYVSANYPEGRNARNRAVTMIDKVLREIEANKSKVALAKTASDVRNITRSGKKAILMGIEGGHALATSLAELRNFARLGVRYVSPTHVNTNSWADASQSAPKWGGLNDTGRLIVREMNKLGILVDVSHVSDNTFWDILDVSLAPVIASHSSVRSLTDNVRNLSDNMLKSLAAKGGVVMINYFNNMINPRYNQSFMTEVYHRLKTQHNNNYYQLWRVVAQVSREQHIPPATHKHIVDHIDYAVKLIGIDHVALGSDFDGAAMPVGMEDVTKLPWITYELLKRGYSEQAIYKILGGNTLRVLEQAEQISKQLSK